jgi:DNA (cytosine-5)-methyltransferase 1
MTVGSLFSGIGGFDLGFERAGFEIKWQVEIDDYASAVLAKHWPKVRRYRDVRTVHGEATHVADADEQRETSVYAYAGDGRALAAEARQHSRGRGGRPISSAACCLEPVDVICGGFPCQPHSLAGKRAGASDERDLWPHFARLIRACQPRWIVAENVPGLLSSDAGRFFGTVLGDLAACGYDAEWDCLPASAFGAPHRRDRVWIVAYPRRGCGEHWGASEHVSQAQSGVSEEGIVPRDGVFIGHRSADVADANQSRSQRWERAELHERASERVAGSRGASVADADAERWDGRSRIFGTGRGRELTHSGWWEPEPNVGRVAHGVSARVDRLKGLGNAIVPQIAEWIAHRITEAEDGGW